MFTKDRLIGEGGSGSVYEVHDEEGLKFAIKVLDASKATHEKLKRFKNEIFFCIEKRHRNILRILDHGLVLINGIEFPFYVMPIFEMSLRHLMKQGIAHDEALPIFSQLIDGIEAAHMFGVVHRDIKPENILCNPNDNLFVVADFGIAHFTENMLITAVETRDSERLANFQYAAPEQRMKGKAVEKQADIYALGLILNELFTGEIPIGTSYKTIAAVSSSYRYLDEIVASMIRQSPGDRIESIDKVKQELIARNNEFVARQKLNEARSVVIKAKEISDPIVDDPIKLVSADWEDGVLHIRLSQPVNQNEPPRLSRSAFYVSPATKTGVSSIA